MDIVIVILLIIGSGFFSGLTIALMSFEVEDLETIKAIGGKGDSPYSSLQALQAKKIIPLIQDKKLLVVTLLLGNTAVNAALSVFLSGLVGAGIVAGVVSTALIVIFGEIIPVVVITNFALSIGAKISNLIKLLIYLFYPISYFIILGLNYLESFFETKIYGLSRKEIIHNVKTMEKDENSDIDAFDRDIIEGALSLNKTMVKKVMTPKEKVLKFTEDTIINNIVLQKVIDSGHTRIPIFKTTKEEIYKGVFNVKKLIGKEPIGKKIKLYTNEKLNVELESKEKCDDAINIMIENKTHLALVKENNKWIGIVTLEDMLEEILKREIIDEYDKH